MRPPLLLVLVLFSLHACQATTTAMDLGTKTPYPASPTPSSPKQGGGEACTLKHLTVVARHGSRHSGHIASINSLAASLDLPYIYPSPPSTSGLLIPLGVSEHQALGARLAERWPELRPNPYSPRLEDVN